MCLLAADDKKIKQTEIEIVIPGGQSSYFVCMLEMIFEQRPEGLEGEYSRQKKQYAKFLGGGRSDVF